MDKRCNRFARRLVVSMALVFALGGAVPALAAGLDASGATGLMTIPTADVVGAGRLALGYHTMAVALSDPDGYWNEIAVTAGLTNELELGVSSGFLFGGNPVTSFNAKYRIIPETSHVPALAVGVDNVITGHGTFFYLVLSKAIPELTTRLHAGVGNGGLFFGLSKVLNPVSVRGKGASFPETTLMAEWNAGVNLGVRFQPIAHLLLDAAVLNLRTPMFGIQYAVQF